MYTIKDSANTIMSDQVVAKNMGLFAPDMFYYMIPKKKRDIPLEEVAKELKTPWGMDYPAEILVDSANLVNKAALEKSICFIPLWEKHPAVTDGVYFPQYRGGKESAALMIYKMPDDSKRKPVLICPGGAYAEVALGNEGHCTAEELIKRGYFPFVLKYRCNTGNETPKPQIDATLAIKYIRANAEKYNLSTDKVLMIGYSAGGHLAASQSAYPEEYSELLQKELEGEDPLLAKKYEGISGKADYVCLGYPCTTMLEDYDSMGIPDLHTGCNEELKEKLTIPKHLTTDYPKTFLWCSKTDSTVPCSNTINMGEALKEAGVPCRYIVYPDGEHGNHIAAGTSAEGWIDEMLAFFEF